MRALMLCAAAALTLAAVTPAFAEGGWSMQDHRDNARGGGGNVGGAYVDETRLAIHNLNNSGSGANTSHGGSYDQSACCTFAPGGLPKGDEVNTLTLPELARGEDPEGVRVRTVPRFHSLFPRTAVW